MNGTECEPRRDSRLVDGLRIAFEEAGSGPPVVFVHGWPVSSVYWSNLRDRVAATHRYVAVDLTGFGRSDRSPPGSGRYDMTGQALMLVGFLGSLGAGPVNLVGHSMGGLIALLAASMRPDRVRRLVAVAAPVRGSAGVHPVLRLATWPILRELVVRGMHRPALRRLFSGWFVHRGAVPRAVLDGVDDAADDAVREGALSLLATDLRSTLATLPVPTRILYGECDRVITPTQPLMARARIPSSDLVVLADCGHCPSLELPDAFWYHVRSFLDQAQFP